MLCNSGGDSGSLLRDAYKSVIGAFPAKLNGKWILGDLAKRDTPQQRSLFELLAGKWMGKDHRRGVPYIWSVSHLADGKGRTSPRSFLAAIRAAAVDTNERHMDYAFALHYESIKRGVQAASEIRIAEIGEDNPWVNRLCEPLSGLTVPCLFEVIVNRWSEYIPNISSISIDNQLPPQDVERGWTGVFDDLVRLGLFEKMRDERVNMPDLYRVGFGLSRKGGVKPMK